MMTKQQQTNNSYERSSLEYVMKVISKRHSYLDTQNFKFTNLFMDYSKSYLNPSADPNFTLCEYEVLGNEPYAVGGFSEIFKLCHINDSKIIIKKVNKDLDYRRELRMLLYLQSQSVIELIYYKPPSKDNWPELYFEFFEQTFSDIYLSLGHGTVKIYLQKMLQAINHCHSLNIIHGDIKPENIVVHRKSMKLKLIDFGSAQWYKGKMSDLEFGGTMNYAAPEWLEYMEIERTMRRTNKGKPKSSDFLIDYGIDVWAVGIILLEMIFKRKPYFETGEGILKQINRLRYTLQEELPRFHDLKPLLGKLLCRNNIARITAKGALSDSLFSIIKFLK